MWKPLVRAMSCLEDVLLDLGHAKEDLETLDAKDSHNLEVGGHEWPKAH